MPDPQPAQPAGDNGPDAAAELTFAGGVAPQDLIVVPGSAVTAATDAAPLPAPPLTEALPSGAPKGEVRAIVIAPDPVLRAPCDPAGEMTFAALRALTADLFETMYAARGRGLAAPQIGVSRRVFVMDEGWKRGEPSPLVVIDPELRWRSRKTARAAEECLSIPGQPVEMRRPVSVRLTFFDLNGIEVDLTLDGIAARIAQHELDHLNGILIGDAPPSRPPKSAKPARRKPRA